MSSNASHHSYRIKLPAGITQYLKRHTLFGPIILSFFCFIVVVVAAIIIWFSTSLKFSLEKTVYDTAQHEAEITADRLQFALEDFDSMSGQLGVIAALTPTKYHGNEYYAYEAIKGFNSSSYRYDNLMFYYPNEKMMLSVLGTAELQVFFDDIPNKEAFRALLEHAGTSILTSTAAFGAKSHEARLLLIQPLLNKTTAIFMLTNSTLSEMLAPASEAASSRRLIVDSAGQVLWSSHTLPDTMAASPQAEITSPSRSQLTVNGEKYICSTAALTNGASLIILDAVSTHFHTVETAIRVLVIICSLLILLGIGLLFIGTRRAAEPIATLVDDFRSVLPDTQSGSGSTIDVLRTACAQYSALAHESNEKSALFSDEQMRDAFILRLICGQYADASSRENLCNWLHVDLPFSYYCACLLLFDEKPDKATREQLRQFLNSIEQNHCRSFFCMTPDGQSAVGMINLEKNDSAHAFDFCEKLLQGLMPISPVSIGLGRICDRPDLMGRSYLEACTAMDQRLVQGRHSCILYTESASEDKIDAYPKELLDRFVMCLRQWDTVAIQRELNTIIEYIHASKLSLQQIKCICFDLTSSFVKEFNMMGNLTTSVRDMTFDVFSIAEYTSVAELARNIVELSRTIETCIELRRERRRDSLVSGCQALIEENLSNPQFSLSMLAEHFEVTPQTLRRRFKEATGQTLSNYMILQRIDLAKRLLSETNLSMNEICNRCGYIDISSFTRLFKAEVGISPGVYRETHTDFE